VVHAGVLQADGVDHALRGFRDAVRGVAKARLARGALQDDGADIAVGEALDARVFLAEADTAGQQDNGGGEIQSAEFQAEGFGRGARRGERGGSGMGSHAPL